MSGRVTSSGYMPPVCSNSVRRSCVSSTSKRSAMPGRYQTGSMAALVTATSPLGVHDLAVDLSRPLAIASLDLRQVDARLGDGDGRADVDALGRSRRRSPRRPGGPRDRARRSCRRSSTADAGRSATTGWVLVSSGRGSDRARRRRRPARDRSNRSRRGVPMTLRSAGRDTVPMIGAALAGGRGAPVDRESGLGARRRVRGEPDMVGAVWTGHCRPQKADGPPFATGLISHGCRSNRRVRAPRRHVRHTHPL